MTISKLDPYYRYQHEAQLSKNAERVKRKEEERLEKERLKQINEEAKRQTEANTEDEFDALILDAKKSGNYNIASDLLDRKAQVQAKRESDRLWLRHGTNPEDITLEVMKKMKQRYPDEFLKVSEIEDNY